MQPHWGCADLIACCQLLEVPGCAELEGVLHGLLLLSFSCGPCSPSRLASSSQEDVGCSCCALPWGWQLSDRVLTRSTGFLPTASQALISHLSQGSDSLVLFQTSLTTWYCTCGHLPVTCSDFLLRGVHVLYFPLLTLDSWSGFRAVLQVVYIRQSWSGIPALQWMHSLNSWSHVDGC